MKINVFTVIAACLFINLAFAQNSINNYKYVIVPKKFDFQKENDQYQLNGLTLFLFNKYNFKAIIEGSDYPTDLALNRCLALDSNLIKAPGMFNTKIKVELTDCAGKVVFVSREGASRKKDYKVAYNFAIREAFKSIAALNYKYQSIVKSNYKNNTTQAQINSESSYEAQKLNNKKQIEVSNTGTLQQKAVKADKNKLSVISIKEKVPVLYAQAITNGFQLVDSTPQVIYSIINTGLKDVFLVKDKEAIVYKNATKWVIEFYNNGVLKQQPLNIKF